MSQIAVPVSYGELIDKITILQIKSERIRDEAKLANVQHELQLLMTARDQAVAATPQLTDLTTQLKTINEQLWEIEDEIRVCERNQDFGNAFIELARAVYKTNDQRAAVKRQVNELLGSHIQEEKDYVDYQSPGQD